MRTVNVGVIGVGAMGENHVRVYHKMDEANLIAVSDVSERALKKIERKYGAKGYTEYSELLENPDIEVVSVCVPTTFHHAVVMEAIKNKKHVLVEKPIAFTLNEAEEMIAAAKEAGVILATGHVERFNPAVQKAKELIEEEYYSRFMKGLWVVPDRTEEEVAVAAIAAGKARFEFGEKPDV